MIALSHISGLKTTDDLSRLVKDQYDSDFEALATELSRSLNALLGSDLQEANRLVAALKRVRGVFPTLFGPRLLAMEARYELRAGHASRARQLYVRAIQGSRKLRDWLRVAQMRQGLMDVQMYLGQNQEAIATGSQALTWFRRRGMSPQEARVMTNLGNIYHRLDKNRVALDYYAKAAAIFSDGGVPLAIVQYNQANIYANLGKTSQAAKLYRQAAEAYRVAGLDLYDTRARYSLGYLSFLADKHTEALLTLEAVLDEFRGQGDTKAIAVTQLDLSEINLHLNQYGTAIALGQDAAEQFKKLGMTYEQGKANLFVAQALARCGDRRPADLQLRKAEGLFLREGNLLWQGMARLERSLLSCQANRHRKALEQAREARGLFGRSGDERRRIDADIVILETMMSAGDVAGAARRAKVLARRKLLISQEHRLSFLQGNCSQTLGHNTEALRYFEKAAEKVERMLEGLYPDEMRFFFAIDKMSTYLGAAECLLREGEISESFDRFARGLAVVNYRVDQDRVSAERIPPELLSKREMLRSSLRRMETTPRTSHRSASGPGDARAVEQQLWQVERKIRTSHYRKYKRPVIAVPSSSLAESLKRDETALVYTFMDGKVGVFVNQRNSVSYHNLNLSKPEFQSILRELQFVMERPVLDSSLGTSGRAAVDFYLNRLHGLLVEPLMNIITGTELIVVADGPFAQVPWLALADSDLVYLKDRCQIRLISSPADLNHRRRPPQFSDRSQGTIFAVASDYLPSVAKEGQKINELFERSRLRIGDDATSVQLRSDLGRRASFLHVATHAARSSENPLFSRLLMKDGPFFPFDLFGTGVNARLVSLSGCLTAAPGLYYGDSFSLAKAFHQAGARYVLASLWSVSDRLSMEMMVEFYRHLSLGSEITYAYHMAVEHITAIDDNPAFWSSFALIGI